MNIDFAAEAIGKDKDGNDVFFKDIWPSTAEVNDVVKRTVTPELFRREYANVFGDNERWNEIQTSNEPLYTWDEDSTYIANPPFFEGLSPEPGTVEPLTWTSCGR